MCTAHFPEVLLFSLLYYLWRAASIPPRGVFILVASCVRRRRRRLTWAAVGGQVAVAVAVARSAAVDAAVVVVGAGVGPRVGQPGLRGRLPDVQQAGPVGTKKRRGVNARRKEMKRSQAPVATPMFENDEEERDCAQRIFYSS